MKTSSCSKDYLTVHTSVFRLLLREHAKPRKIKKCLARLTLGWRSMIKNTRTFVDDWTKKEVNVRNERIGEQLQGGPQKTPQQGSCTQIFRIQMPTFQTQHGIFQLVTHHFAPSISPCLSNWINPVLIGQGQGEPTK